jgi:hypothetical protein
MANIWNRYVESAAERFGVPPSLVNSVINVESGGRPDAVSGAGAGGYMQLMPGTYGDLAKQYGFGPDRMDPANNINAGTAYMAQLYKQFGNWPDALSAYNAGPNRWRQVKAGEREAPRETQSYVPKVLAGFEQGKGADVPLFSAQRAATDEDTNRWSNSAFGNLSATAGSGLLNFAPELNYQDGLGPLLNTGQTPSQPPRTDPAALQGTTQTERLDVSGRVNELLQQLMQQPQKSAMSPLQYQLAGMGSAVGELAGVHNRRVGIGEMLGALGGGMTRGTLAGEQAQRSDVAGELDKLLKVGAYQNQERTGALNEANSIIDNRLKDAQTKKALAPTSDADRYKVVGKQIYDTQTGQFTAAPGGVDQGGPLEGTGPEAQFTNAYIMLEQKRASGQQLTQQEQLLYETSKRYLSKPKMVTGPDGLVREVPADPLPTLNAPAPAGAGPAVPPPAGAPSPAAAPPPAATVTVPERAPVRELVAPKPKEIPATAQTAMLTNVDGLRKLNAAIEAAGKSDWTTGNTAGLLNMLPGDTLNGILPGAEGRAAIADIGSMIIHDRSGASVTISETPRLKPFVPMVSDSAETVQMKLGKLKIELEDILRDQSATYSADQAYRENPVVRDVMKVIPPRAPMSGGEGTDPAQRALRSKYGLE